MTKTMLNTTIIALLDQSQAAIVEAGKYTISESKESWIAYMTTSLVLSNLATALMTVRDKMEDTNGQTKV